LIGIVDENLDLDILLEKRDPDSRRGIGQAEIQRREELQAARLQGVAAEAK
jgi:hypothetical protein